MSQAELRKYSLNTSYFVIALTTLLILSNLLSFNLISYIFPYFQAIKTLTAIELLLASLFIPFYLAQKVIVVRIITLFNLCLSFLSFTITFVNLNYVSSYTNISYFDFINVNNANYFTNFPLTVSSILLLCISQILITSLNKTYLKIAQTLNFVNIVIGFVVFADYTYNSIINNHLNFSNLMTVYTALLIMVTASASALTQPQIGVVQLFTSSEIGNKMAKRLFIRLLVTMLFLTYFRLILFRDNLVSVNFGIILFMTSFLVVAILLIWKAANELNKVQSEKYEIEEELKFQNTLLEATPDPMIVVDRNGIIQMMNTQIETVFGYRKDEIIGEKVEVLIPKRFREKHTFNISEYFSAPAVRSMGSELELFVLKSDNTELPVEVSLSPLKFGTELWVVAALRNISERKIFEQKILDLNERLQLANSTSLTGIWEYDIINNNLYWDDVMFEIYDIKRENFGAIFDDWAKAVHPEDLDVTNKHIQRALKGEIDFDTEFRVVWQDGTIHYVRAKALVKRNSEGLPTKMIGTNWDITSRRLLELKASKIDFQNRIFIEEAPTAIAMFDKEMRYIATSAKWLSDYGLNGRDIIGVSHYDIFPEIGDEWKQIHKDCMAGATHSKEEDKFVREDGTIQWLKWVDKPWYNYNNEIGGIIMYTEDITAKKTTEDLLRISEQAFRGNFENAAIGMAILNEKGQWLKVNKKLCEIVGYSDNEMYKLTFQDITHPDDLDADLSLLSQLIAGKIDHYQMEKRYFHKNGRVVNIILAVSMVKDSEGKILYFISQIIDITELKKAENEVQSLLNISQEQNQRLKNFAHIVSHNLRSHSGNISNLIELFIEEKPELKDSDYIQFLKQSSQNLNETIVHLNEVAIINTTLLENLAKLELTEYVGKAIVSLSALAINSNVEIINKVQTGTFVLGMPAYIESIILNFISNGIKYHSKERNSFIEISTKEENNYIVLSFKDNGLGIDLKNNRNKLFGMYKTFHEHEDSRGLGLFITKNQIEAMGGRVEVESEVNIGTTFKVYLKNEKD